MADSQNDPGNFANPNLINIEIQSQKDDPHAQLDVEINSQKYQPSEEINSQKDPHSEDFYTEKIVPDEQIDNEIKLKKERNLAIVKEKLKPGLYDHISEPDEQDDLDKKLNAEVKGGKKTLDTIVKCDPVYMLRKLYEWNYDLGGDLLVEEANQRLYDPYYVTMDEIKDLMVIVKRRQDKRNAVRKEEGNSLKCIEMTNEIGQFIGRGEFQADALATIFKRQAIPGIMSPEEYEEKDTLTENLFGQVEGVRNRETCSKEIKHIKPPSEVDLDKFDDGFDNVSDGGRAENRELLKKEKDALKRWEIEEVELDFLIKEIDKNMNEVLEGIEEMDEEFQDQKKQIQKREKEIDKFEVPFNKTAAKLKITLKRWKSATSVFTQIIMILIQILLIIAFLFVIKTMFMGTSEE